MNKDREHLKLLSIFHYVVGALIALFSSIFIIHIIMGVLMIISPETFNDGHSHGPPAFFGYFFVLFPAIVVLLGWILGGAIIYAGICLKNIKKYTFCLVMAGLACMFMPFGTVLGAFTIIVLLRPSVKELFMTGQDNITAGNPYYS